MTTPKWHANQELTTEERSNQAGTSDASKLTRAHLVETALESSPILASLIRSRPHRRPSLEFFILTRFNSSCVRMSEPKSSSSSSMVTTALGARERQQRQWFPMPSCANNTSCGSDRIRKATLLGQSAVQVQRVCSILRKRDKRRHSTTLCPTSDRLPLLEPLRRDTCRVTSQATPLHMRI